MKRQLIIDEERNLAFDPQTGLVDFMETMDISAMKMSLSESVRLVEEYDIDGEERKVIVPEIIVMVEGVSHNHRMYTAESMKRRKSNEQGSPSGASSFTIPVGRPILINHSVYATSPYKPIIGRIRKAQYVKAGKDLNESKAHIKIWPEITDPIAIESIENGEFESVSVYSNTNELTCSICGTDIVKQMTNIVTKTRKSGKEGIAFQELFLRGMDDEDGCSHMPGMKYDGKLCYFIVGDFWARETSFVTIPGIDAARVTKKNTKSVSESAPDGKNRQIWPTIAFVSEEELTGGFEGAVITEGLEEQDSEVENSDWTKEDDEMLEELFDLLIEELEKEGYFETDEAAYSLDDIEEGKLSTKARKKLKSSSFCGPGKSFPVPDCCAIYSTRIPLLDGSTVKIGELAENLEDDTWVYGFDINTRSVVPAKVSAAWLAIKDADIYKVTLDNGETVECTGNHPFLMRDMTYKRADELSMGDSLMPFRTKMESVYGQATYEKIYQPWYNYWEYTHQMVAREHFQQPKEKLVDVHHKNECKADNRPGNLQYLPRKEHMQLHGIMKRGSASNHKGSADGNKAKSNLMKKRMAEISNDPKLKSEHANRLSKGRRTYNWDEPDTEIGDYGITLNDCSYAKRVGVSLSYIANVIDTIPATLSHWLKKGKCKGDLDRSCVRDKMIAGFFEYTFGYSIYDIYDQFSSGRSFNSLSEEFKIDRTVLSNWFVKLGLRTDQVLAAIDKMGKTTKELHESWKNGEITLVQMEAETGLKAERFSKRFNDLSVGHENHKVVSVEKIGIGDAYDMEVPLTSNFALVAGIFVHNSHVTAARRLIGKYKGPGKKSTILACVNRKARELGCDDKGKKKSKEMKITEELILKILNGSQEDFEFESDDLAKFATVAKIKLTEANDSIEGYKSDLEAKDTKIVELEAEVDKITSERDEFSKGLSEIKEKTHRAAVDNFVAVLEEDLERELDDEQRKAVEALSASQIESLVGIFGERSLNEDIEDLQQEDPGKGKEGISKPGETKPDEETKNSDQITAESFLKEITG